jgi:4-amino-4-deoxy-L-arabinose transferase-like glycosyltransferase
MQQSSSLTGVPFGSDLGKLKLAVGIGVGLLSILLNVGIKGTLTLDWQHLYRPEDFHTWADLWRFMGELQTGISPFWAFLEVSAQLIFGSTALFSMVLYPLAIGLNAYWATTLFARRRWQVLLSAGLSLVFAVAIRFIHKGNPQLYDVLMPALLLGWVAALQRLRDPRLRGSWRMGWCVLAGLLLSVLELTRTLIFPLLPLLLLFSYLAIRPLPLKHFLVFLVPILLLSGSWHFQQYSQHGKLHWSNHDGFNMQKSWVEFTGPIPSDFVDDPPLYEGGMDNINTDRHTAYNKVVQRQVREAILRQPGKAAGHFAERLLAFYRPKTVLFLGSTPTWYNVFYRPAVWLCALSMLIGLLRMVWLTVRAPLQRKTWLDWGQPAVILMAVTLLVSCIFAVGEVGEEARFMISILPLLAATVGNSMNN